jgi:hypothetical protein
LGYLGDLCYEESAQECSKTKKIDFCAKYLNSANMQKSSNT